MNTNYVLRFQEINKTMSDRVGGKGANLGELSRIEGIKIPDGFCITTDAYKESIAENTELHGFLDQLDKLQTNNLKGISEIGAKIRQMIERIAIPEDIADAICIQIEQSGEAEAFAVRSSATAEDLPSASFAGQQDTYLNIQGKEAILKHVSKCWASLFTDRAIVYRLKNKFDHRKVWLAVVVQKMIFPEVAGTMFTADPVNSDRKVVSIDASFGLGEALVSGLVNADNYKVREGKITDKRISVKKLGIYAVKEGGTKEKPVRLEDQDKQALTDKQVLTLEHIGRTLESHFGQPQDIEWCMANDTIYLVQSRPITTLFPIPPANDNENHVYISVGHQQMMTDAMSPLGLSFYLSITPAPMRTAGGRLFVDVTPLLASAEKRENFFKTMGKADPLTIDALTTIIERDGFIKPSENDKKV